ncbi:MAG: flavodoxin domain-containing protein [Bacteroidota bacterium]
MSAISIFFGSVFGNSQNVAEKLHEHLNEKGVASEVITTPTIDDLVNAESIIVVSSTCGLGDIPPNLEELVEDARDQGIDLGAKSYAVAALGDSSYVDTFCGGGEKVYAWLEELKGNPVTPLLRVDAIETFEPEIDVIAWADGFVGDLVAA